MPKNYIDGKPKHPCSGCRAHSGTDCVIPSPELGCPRDNLRDPLREWVLDAAEKQIQEGITGVDHDET